MFSVLELSKLLMYQFHDYVLQKFDAKLLFKDTDSFVYKIKYGNDYDQRFNNKLMFGFDVYPINYVYYDISNKKILGKMKDELNGVKIVDFVC